MEINYRKASSMEINLKKASSIAYPWYVVGVMFLAYTCSFIDRTILNLLVTPIKLDLGISDTQMSLLQGPAFAVFYVTIGLLIARLADNHSRRTIIIIGLILWCIMTATGAIATSFLMLFVLRIGVGVGEAALTPSATSMLSDLFPKERLSTAISVYAAAPYFGISLAYIIGGALLDHLMSSSPITLPIYGDIRPWQSVFLFVGLPGLFIALLILLTIREPDRQHLKGQKLDEKVTFSDFFSYFKNHQSVYIRHFVGFSMFSLVGYTISSWLPTYYLRTYGLTNTEVGNTMGVILFFGGTIGIITGGVIGDLLMNKRHDAPIVIGLVATIGSIIFGLSIIFATSSDSSLLMIFPAYFFKTLPLGVALAALHIITLPKMRAQITAAYLFVDAMIGLGFGPTAVALFTDYVFADEAKLGLSIASVIVISMVIATIALWSVLKPYRDMVEQLHNNNTNT
jgi:MFS family permease